MFSRRISVNKNSAVISKILSVNLFGQKLVLLDTPNQVHEPILKGIDILSEGNVK